jgi:hypothetical protein
MDFSKLVVVEAFVPTAFSVWVGRLEQAPLQLLATQPKLDF